jgi:hypothetical protein
VGCLKPSQRVSAGYLIFSLLSVTGFFTKPQNYVSHRPDSNETESLSFRHMIIDKFIIVIKMTFGLSLVRSILSCVYVLMRYLLQEQEVVDETYDASFSLNASVCLVRHTGPLK